MITTARRKLEADLTNLIKAIAYWDIHIENYKIGIAENHQFNVNAAFHLLDYGNKGFITQKNIHQYMGANQLNCSHKECDQIMEIYFKNEKILLQQFIDFILPATHMQLRNFHLHKNELYFDNAQQQFARETLRNLFERIIHSLRELTKLREHLQNEAQFDVQELWKLISQRNPVMSGNLTQNCLTQFIQSNGSHFSSQEFQALLRYLLIKDNRDYLSQMEFNYLLLPPQFVISNNFNDQIQEQVRQKYQELQIPVPQYKPHNVMQTEGIFNFRKVFDPVREGRPQFKFDSQYMDQLRDYKAKYLAPSRNYELQYRNNPLQVRDHDFFYQDFYLHLHNEDQEELYFNRFGKKYAYS